MATMTVQEQLDIYMKDQNLPTTLGGGGISFYAIFMEPTVPMSETLVDSKGRVWTHCKGSTYYKNQTGHTCPLFYIENWAE